MATSIVASIVALAVLLSGSQQVSSSQYLRVIFLLLLLDFGRLMSCSSLRCLVGLVDPLFGFSARWPRPAVISFSARRSVNSAQPSFSAMWAVYAEVGRLVGPNRPVAKCSAPRAPNRESGNRRCTDGHVLLFPYW